MSSVGSSDSSTSNSANDVIRRNREDAQRTESDMVKKHQKEIRRLNEQHYAEVEDLKKNHEAQIDELRKDSHEEINERDHKYQKDIEDIRDLYKKQLQGQAEETSKREEVARAARKDTLDERLLHDRQLKELNKANEKIQNNQEYGYESSLKANREAQEHALSDTRDKLVRHYEDEAKSQREQVNAKLGGMQREFGEYRQTRDSQLKDSELREIQTKQRDGENLIRAVRGERQAAVDSNNYLRDGFKDGLEKTRERFEKTQADARQAEMDSQRQFKNSIGDRVENQVNRLKQENTDLKSEQARQSNLNQHTADREIANMADSYQKNVENYRAQRDAAVQESNDRVHKSVEKVRKEYDGQVVQQSRYYQEQADMQNRINRKALDDQKGGYEAHSNQVKTLADARVKSIYENAADEKARISEMREEDHNVIQRSHQEEMRNLRDSMEQDKQVAVSTLEERLQKQELQHAERMNQVVAKYEKQVQTLKDQMLREKKSSDENLKRTVEDMQRSQKVAIDQIEAQNRTKLHQLDQQHDEEVRMLNKRNDDKLNQVIVETKRS